MKSLQIRARIKQLLTGWRNKPGAFNRNATSEDVRLAYQLFLRREPEPEGLQHYARLIAPGLALHHLVRAFVNSDEHKKLVRQEYQVAADAQADLVVVDLGGYSVLVDPAETDFGESLIATKQYEPHVGLALTHLLQPGQTFVDVGANIGCLSFLAAKLVGTNGTVIAVEPNPTNLQQLYAGIVYNQFHQVRVLPYAASNQSTYFSLAGGSSNTYVTSAKAYQASGFYAQARVLDQELAALPALHLIKMDIEGHEPLALQGLAATLRKHRPYLLTEFNPRCLRENLHYDPLLYLQQLFGYYGTLQAISAFNDSATFGDADTLWAFWQTRNAQLTQQRALPDGMLHFDLIATEPRP